MGPACYRSAGIRVQYTQLFQGDLMYRTARFGGRCLVSKRFVKKPLTNLFRFVIILVLQFWQHDPLAQAVEHLTFNQGVPGSIPGWITIKKTLSNGLRGFSICIEKDGFYR